MVERPQQCSQQQLELAQGLSPRGLTYLCTEKAGYINSAPLYICHEASGGKYLPRAVLFNLEPGVIDAVRASSLGCLIRPGNLVGKTGLKTQQKS